MKTAIGGAWMLGLVMVFMLIFVAYLAVSLNYSRAFQLNSAVISILERQEGHCGTAMDIIPAFLEDHGYGLRVASCGIHGTGFPNDGVPGYLYCLQGPFPVRNYDEHGREIIVAHPIPTGYYRLTLFFRFDLPIIGQIFTFPVTSRTRPIHWVCCSQPDNQGRHIECY